MLAYLAFEPYGWFIWPCFAVFALGVGGVLAETLIAARRSKRLLAQLEAAKARP
ncbi:MAG: heme exporter protein CcmD [Alphaproteobacteria bacterium]|nr:heme exporter protein CcmD [Alphaproteobacteria bacterium]